VRVFCSLCIKQLIFGAPMNARLFGYDNYSARSKSAECPGGFQVNSAILTGIRLPLTAPVSMFLPPVESSHTAVHRALRAT
jgi:hypothetical protein